MPDGIVKPPEELAELVEDTIFSKFKNTDAKYKAHVRSRIFNLKVWKYMKTMPIRMQKLPSFRTRRTLL